MIFSIGSPKPLALGMVDGRNKELEQTADIARRLQRLFPRIQGGRAYLGPSCGLEYLTIETALAKFALLPKDTLGIERLKRGLVREESDAGEHCSAAVHRS